MLKAASPGLSFHPQNPTLPHARVAVTLPTFATNGLRSKQPLSRFNEHRPGALERAGLAAAIPSARPIYCDVGTRFGERLRGLRRGSNMTQIDMAVAFGIDRSYISDVECGKKGISLATLEVVALGFHISLSELLRDL